MTYKLPNKNNTSSNTKHLQSEIIGQKKQFIFKVEQTNDFVFPNEEFKYYIYLKNISDSDITNVHVLVEHNSSININKQGSNIQNIGTIKKNDVKLIYLNAACNGLGTFYTHFICYGDGTGLFYKTLKIQSGYDNVSNELIHRIHIYDFTPYEDTFLMSVDDYNNQVTQLFKTQKLPFKAGEEPFPLQKRNIESSIRPFYNIESESFVSQYDELSVKGFLPDGSTKKEIYESARNTKEHAYQYIGRENFNENALESFEGKNLFEIINSINENSQYFRAKFLKTGTNQLLNDFKEYNPNGFIYRFGLLSSEIYHHVGVLPTFSYMSDYLFRWAPNEEPLNLIPQKKAMNWNQHKWAGQGWRVYRIATKEYMQTQEWQDKFEQGLVDRWEIIEDFEHLKSAESYIERQKYYDDVEKSQLALDYDKYDYIIRESFYDNGVFFVNIPLDKIPTNFYLLNNDDIEALIQRAKPLGVKPLIRYTIERIFDHQIEFGYYPILKPYTEFELSEEEMTYFIQTKRYQDVVEEICNQSITSKKLVPYGKTVLYNGMIDNNPEFLRQGYYPRVIESTLKSSNQYVTDKFDCTFRTGNKCSYQNKCAFNKNNTCTYNTDKTNPDFSINLDIQQENQVDATLVDNSLVNLKDLTEMLYQNNTNNLGFSIPSKISGKPKADILQEENNFITEWAKNHNYNTVNIKLYESNTETQSGFTLDGQPNSRRYNIFKIPIMNSALFRQGEYETGIGILDSFGRYHYVAINYDINKQNYYINYLTSFNNTYKSKKDGCQDNITGLVCYVITYKFKKIVVFFIEESSTKLHYFHHIIVSNLSNLFLFGTEELFKKIKKDNTVETILLKDILTCEYLNSAKISFETPFVYEYNSYKPSIIQGGSNWTNLYRLNDNISSYTYIQNNDNKEVVPNDIILHFDNINIPDNCIIKNLNLKVLADTSGALGIYNSCGIQTNNNFEDAINNKIIFKPNAIECYPSSLKGQYYYKNQIQLASANNNDKSYAENNSLLKQCQLFNESVNIDTIDYINDYNGYVDIKKNFWIELSDFTYYNKNCNNINDFIFVIEGFNKGPEVTLSYQLMCLNDSAREESIQIESGYFFKKIKVPFLTSFTLDNIRLRFKFNELNNTIQLFDSYINIDFKNKEEQFIDYILTDDISIKSLKDNIHQDQKQVLNFNCQDENKSFTPELMNNGFSINLSFDNISPGDFYRLYTAELEITYQQTESKFLLNKNQYENIADNIYYTAVSGQVNNAYLSGMFYDDVATVSQLDSTIDSDNHGIELKDTIFQSFIARSDNITSIELFPNGFIGNPDDTLKIGLYSNHGNTPYRLIKEIYASGWTKTNKNILNAETIKYDFNIDNLIVNETYWLKIEVENQKPNSFYLLRYTTERQKNFKLLLKENNDYINTFGSLEFNIYSRNLTKSFNQLPTVQDYFDNPYIMLGLHKAVGTISNIRVKKKSV